jgi:hypothetical protein
MYARYCNFAETASLSLPVKDTAMITPDTFKAQIAELTTQIAG